MIFTFHFICEFINDLLQNYCTNYIRVYKTCCLPNIQHVQWQLVSTAQTTQSDTGVQCGLSFHFEKGNLCVANIVSETGVDPLSTEKVASVLCVCVHVCGQ